jgi:hypothetical protein
MSKCFNYKIFKFPYKKKKRVYLQPLGNKKYKVFYRKRNGRLNHYGEIEYKNNHFYSTPRVMFKGSKKPLKNKNLYNSIRVCLAYTAETAPVLFKRK